jgi:hypothetical protein
MTRSPTTRSSQPTPSTRARIARVGYVAVAVLTAAVIFLGSFL